MLDKRNIRTHKQTLNFTQNLIKGKIAEVVFQEMVIDSGKCMVLPLGYEHTTPILAQYVRSNKEVQRVLENIRNAPDFALIEHENNLVHLVEVKYRRNFSREDILIIANELVLMWPTAQLFLATSEGFYFDKVSTIIETSGEMKNLTHSIGLHADDVSEYHKLLVKYEV